MAVFKQTTPIAEPLGVPPDLLPTHTIDPPMYCRRNSLQTSCTLLVLNVVDYREFSAKGPDMTHAKRSTCLAAVATLFVAPMACAVDFYKIDPEHTSVIFGCAHAGLSYTYGFFRDVSGQYKIDESNPANCAFQLVIRADSLDTNNAERDKHLRSPDFFDVQQFPDITFMSTRCDRVETQDRSVVYKVAGDLKIHGVTRPVQLNLRMLAKKPGATGNDMRTGFLCSVELKRSEFKMTNLLENDKVGDAIAVTVSFEGAQQAPPAGTPQTR